MRRSNRVYLLPKKKDLRTCKTNQNRNHSNDLSRLKLILYKFVLTRQYTVFVHHGYKLKQNVVLIFGVTSLSTA